jgi:hypothetical protein
MMIVTALIVVAAFAAGLGIVILAEPSLRQLFLRWYMDEVSRTAVPETPSDAIATYPLA